MESLNLILFISIAVPLCMMLFVCKGRTRLLLTFLVLGISVCLFSSEFSGVLFNILPFTNQYLTINLTPFTEEFLKMIPLLIYVFLYSPDDEHIIECSIATGVGFSILENAFILASHIDMVSIPLALIRGFGAGMMHGLCTFAVGYGMTFIRKRKKLFYTGTMALFSLAVMFHSLYNIWVQSDYPVVGYLMPIITFTSVIIILKKKNRI